LLLVEGRVNDTIMATRDSVRVKSEGVKAEDGEGEEVWHGEDVGDIGEIEEV